jgi:hypothetical protein
MFIKDKNIDIRLIMSLPQRREYAEWYLKNNREFMLYNRTEQVMIFLKYHYGYGQRRIVKKMRISQYSVRKFFNKMKERDRF